LLRFGFAELKNREDNEEGCVLHVFSYNVKNTFLEKAGTKKAWKEITLLNIFSR